MSTYNFNTDTLYDKTDKGLKIIEHYLSDCKYFKDALQNPKKRHFHLRGTENDKTASAMLIMPGQKIDKKNNVAPDYWRVHDFGGSTKTPISLAMEESGLEYYDCLKMLYELFKLDGTNGQFFQPEKEFKTCDKDDKRDIGWFNVVTKKEITHLDIIGKYLTPEIAKTYFFESVDFYESIYFNEKTKEKCYMKITSTEQYPIFCYCPDEKNKTWYKLYSPYAVADKNGRKFKHGYLGQKPKRYVHGLQQILDKIDTETIDFLTQQIKEAESERQKNEYIEQRENLKLKQVIICSGGSDGMNVASLGYDAIWFNSEAEQISYEEYNTLKPYVKSIYNLPDVDKSGYKYGYEVAENYWNIKSIWLPKEKLVSDGKDFRDWMKFYSNADLSSIKFQFSNLLTGALKCKFFERNSKNKVLRINTAYLHYFLKVRGFYIYYPDKVFITKTNEKEFIFIRIEDNIVYQETCNTIKKYCEKYMIDKGQSIEVINLIKNTTQFTEKNLLGMDSIVLNFQNYTADSQTFYFKNQFAIVTADGVKLKPYRDLESHVWNDKIIDHNISLEKPFFEYYTDENGRNRIKILRSDCEYQNFLINTSRTSWRKDLELQFENDIEAGKKYHEENRFRLNSDFLTDEENLIQEQHFASKLFAIGYMMHKFKKKSFARMLYIMDDKEKTSEEDRNGGSGKSMILDGLDCLLNNRFRIDGMQPNLLNDRFILDGVTKEKDYILIEDLAEYHNITTFYNWITSSLSVNPKQKTPFEIGFFDAPKLALTSNYGLKNSVASTLRRLLFISTSDYYHNISDDYKEERRVSHDFGHDLFSWSKDSKQPSIHFGFLFECFVFYLQHRENEVLAPQKNIDLNNAKAGIGDVFIEWCESYFTETIIENPSPGLYDEIKGTLNEYIPRSEMQDSYKQAAGKFAKTSSNFKKSLIQYCKLKEWEFNPKDLQQADGTIKKAVVDNKGKRQSVEHFYIRTSAKQIAELKQVANKLESEAQSVKTIQSELFNENAQDNINTDIDI